MSVLPNLTAIQHLCVCDRPWPAELVGQDATSTISDNSQVKLRTKASQFHPKRRKENEGEMPMTALFEMLCTSFFSSNFDVTFGSSYLLVDATCDDVDYMVIHSSLSSCQPCKNWRERTWSNFRSSSPSSLLLNLESQFLLFFSASEGGRSSVRLLSPMVML
jgi:hypothetical protein